MQPHSLPRLTRANALARLDAFAEYGLGRYAERRNFDLGPTRHVEVVSQLSPYLQRRLISESEVLSRVQSRTDLPPAARSKYIDEVLWRAYWRSRLELEPGLWNHYVQSVSLTGDITPAQVLGEWIHDAEHALSRWQSELETTGYLHNHARMWWASFWIFSGGGSWQSGAHYFYRHLLDGDPASNTLSWRWVAGLHTRGKHYLASPDNIARYTEGRLVGQATRGAPHPASRPLEDNAPAAQPDDTERRRFVSQPSAPLVLVLDPIDLSLETWLPQALEREHNHPRPPIWILGIDPGLPRFERTRSKLVLEASRTALADALQRAEAHWHAPVHLVTGSSIDVAQADLVARLGDDVASRAIFLGARSPAGPWRDFWNEWTLAWESRGLPAAHWQQMSRTYDEQFRGLARGGFFGFRERALALLKRDLT